jgi:hypothetical protein
MLLAACVPQHADATHSASPAVVDASMSRVAWLEGHWFGSQKGEDMEEHWTSASGRALIGMHKDEKNGKMTSFEFLRIEATDNGFVYLASPRGAAITPFAMIESGHHRVVFANPEHDFPQRILYWLDPEGALHARVEGTLRGAPQFEEWIWKRR